MQPVTVKLMSGAAMAFAMFVLSACAMPVQKYPDATVVRLPEKSRPVLVKKIVSQLAEGKRSEAFM